MALLGVVIALRSVAWFTLLAFVPLWVVSLGHSKADGSRLLFLMLLAGAVGTLVLGAVADRIGLRTTLVITQALIAPLILVFVYVGGVAGVVAVMLVGVCVVGTFGVTMVLSQLYLPRHVGMASGLSVGLAMGIGGVAAVVLGAVADAVDLKTALTICAAAPAIGVVVCLRLPAPAKRARQATAPAGALEPARLSTREPGERVERDALAVRRLDRPLDALGPLDLEAAAVEIGDDVRRRVEHPRIARAAVPVRRGCRCRARRAGTCRRRRQRRRRREDRPAELGRDVEVEDEHEVEGARRRLVVAQIGG